MKDIRISIIIPVYNIENYLEDCVRSVLAQTFDGVEILLIDDGSTDASGSLCDTLAQGHENVTVFHKQNGGLSDARNYGLARAKGEYVLFVDGDDQIAPEACAALYADAVEHRADVVVGKARLSSPSSAMDRYEQIAQQAFQMHRVYTGAEYLTGCLARGALRVDVWRSLYRREFLVENGLRFKLGVAHEDEEFTPRVFLLAQRVILTDFAFYYYVNDRANSIMNSVNPKKTRDKLTIYAELLDLYKTVEPRTLRRLLEDDISWKYMDCCKAYRLTGATDLAVDRTLPLRCAYHPKRRIKALVFAISPELYQKCF